MIGKTLSTTTGFVLGIAIYLGILGGAAFFGWWLLTGPGDMSVNPYLYGILAFLVMTHLSHVSAKQSQ